jgi:hypothetical protein
VSIAALDDGQPDEADEKCSSDEYLHYSELSTQAILFDELPHEDGAP